MIMTYIKNYSDKINKLKDEIANADAIVIGAGAGLSTAAGLYYSGERFERYFSDFAKKYGITDIYSGGFYPFESLEIYWAWWSRHIWYNRYDVDSCPLYCDIYKIMKDKNYFVLTTNVDHQFQLAGFNKKRLFYTQGDYGLFQCSTPCHQKTYDNKDVIYKMIKNQKDMKIPTELIPKCTKCSKPMNVNLRCDNTFVQDDGWYQASHRYKDFINKYKDSHILYLELGVGMNTPVIIKYPFWQATANNKNAVYICVNYGEGGFPKEIENQSIYINADIKNVISEIV